VSHTAGAEPGVGAASGPDLAERVAADGLLAPGREVVVLLSGGRDSTCLLDLAARIAGPEAVGALHVNYGLRPAAAGDERRCVELCDQLGVKLEVYRPDPHPEGNLQAWARDVRYGKAAQLGGARGADVAAGHTATDQVETILYRLASSPSRRALLGMEPRDGALIRPLLHYTREETAEWCRGQELDWCEDETNASAAFARGRVRHDLVPVLRSIHPGAERNVIAVAEVLRDEAAVLDLLVDEVLDGSEAVELARLRRLPLALARLVVQRLADRAAGSLAPGVARRTAELLALNAEETTRLDVGAGVRAVVDCGLLRFEPLPSA
jgi:tRNA(Ile)-lysidine synthase